MEPKWKAYWIAPRGSRDRKNYYFRARKKFDLLKLPSRSVVYVAAESYYKLYLNGKVLGKGPARGTKTLNFFDSYDVTSKLNEGENYIAALVSCMNIPTFVAAPLQPAILVQLGDSIATDRTWEILPASEWEPDVPLFTLQTGFMEYRDLRKEPKNWETGGDNSRWEPADELFEARGMPGKGLLPRDVPQLRTSVHLPEEIVSVAMVPPVESENVAETMQKEPHENAVAGYGEKIRGLLGEKGQSVKILPEPDGKGVVTVFDFRRELIGSLELDISAPSGTILDLGYGEELCDGRLRVAGHRADYNFADRYILRAGRQTAGTVLHERGFRMVQAVVRNFSSPVIIHRVRAVDRRYPYPDRGEFVCSDDLLNRIWLMCCETLSACTTDVFIDCPWRERAFWVNDFLVQNITSLQAFGDPHVNKRAFRLAFSSMRDDGLLPGVCPGPERDHLVLLPTNLFLPLMLEDYLLYTGDQAPVAEYLPVFLKILDRFESWKNGDGLLVPPEKYWNFFDWSYELNNFSLNGKNTSSLNWLYVLALESVKRILIRMGDKDDIPKYERLAGRMAHAIDRHFWIQDEKRYAEWSDERGHSELSTHLTHALALLSEHIPDERKTDAAGALSGEKMLAAELYLHHFVFAAMIKCGQEKRALKNIRKYWGRIALAGSPTVWETGVYQPGKAAFNGWGSLCHGFAATPINFLQTVILGIYPVKPGFQSFIVNPTPCGIDSAGGSVPTPRGPITVKWRNDKSAEGISVCLKVPAGAEARCTDGRVLGGGQHEFVQKMDSHTTP